MADDFYRTTWSNFKEKKTNYMSQVWTRYESRRERCCVILLTELHCDRRVFWGLAAGNHKVDGHHHDRPVQVPEQHPRPGTFGRARLRFVRPGRQDAPPAQPGHHCRQGTAVFLFFFCSHSSNFIHSCSILVRSAISTWFFFLAFQLHPFVH